MLVVPMIIILAINFFCIMGMSIDYSEASFIPLISPFPQTPVYQSGIVVFKLKVEYTLLNS
jgi:hypothetical protein